jgi:hypothetical protein
MYLLDTLQRLLLAGKFGGSLAPLEECDLQKLLAPEGEESQMEPLTDREKEILITALHEICVGDVSYDYGFDYDEEIDPLFEKLGAPRAGEEEPDDSLSQLSDAELISHYHHRYAIEYEGKSCLCCSSLQEIRAEAARRSLVLAERERPTSHPED